jgi:hypothetical protein
VALGIVASVAVVTGSIGADRFRSLEQVSFLSVIGAEGTGP